MVPMECGNSQQKRKHQFVGVFFIEQVKEFRLNQFKNGDFTQKQRCRQLELGFDQH